MGSRRGREEAGREEGREKEVIEGGGGGLERQKVEGSRRHD